MEQRQPRERATSAQQIKTLCMKDFLLYKRGKKYLFIEIFGMAYMILLTWQPTINQKEPDNQIIPETIVSDYTRIDKGFGIPWDAEAIKIGVAPCLPENIIANTIQKSLNEALKNVTCFNSVDEMNNAQVKLGEPDYRILIIIPQETNSINEETVEVPYNISLNSNLFSFSNTKVPFLGNLGRPNHWVTGEWLNTGILNLMFFIESEISKHYETNSGKKTFPQKIFIGEGPFNSYPTTMPRKIDVSAPLKIFIAPLIISTLRLLNEKKKNYGITFLGPHVSAARHWY